MSTQLVKANGRDLDAPASPFDGNSEAFDTAMRMAKALSSSSIVPENYRGNAANVTVAMEYAHRLGASVLAVMQNLHIIKGKPSLASSFLIGCVNACGRFSPVRYRWQGKENTDTWGCRAVAVDRESGEECLGPLITIALAKAEGWYSKKDRNGNETSKWQTMPELMLMYRAGAWWSRVYAPDLSLGLHTTDEVDDVGYVRGAEVEGGAASLNAALTAPEPKSREPGEDDGDPPSQTVSEDADPPTLL